MGRDHQSSSYCRYDVNKWQSPFGRRKNNRLISKKPPSPVGTEEENQSRKDLIVIQSSKINLCSQWCVELFYLQSTLWPVVHKITSFAIHIMAKVIPGRPHPTASS